MNSIVANAGVPMLFVQMPLLVLALPVIIVIEALLCRRWLAVSWEQAFWGSTIANLVSTVLGFPLLWSALVLVELLLGGGSMPNLPEPWFSVYTVTVQAAWLLPFEDRFYWMIPTASIVLLVPAFFVTIFVEGYIYRTTFRESAAAGGINAATWNMHLVSYGLLFFGGFALLGTAIHDHSSKPDGNSNETPRVAPTVVSEQVTSPSSSDGCLHPSIGLHSTMGEPAGCASTFAHTTRGGTTHLTFGAR